MIVRYLSYCWLHPLQSIIGGSDIRFSPISFTMYIGLSAHLWPQTTFLHDIDLGQNPLQQKSTRNQPQLDQISSFWNTSPLCPSIGYQDKISYALTMLHTNCLRTELVPNQGHLTWQNRMANISYFNLAPPSALSSRSFPPFPSSEGGEGTPLHIGKQ